MIEWEGTSHTISLSQTEFEKMIYSYLKNSLKIHEPLEIISNNGKKPYLV